MAAKRCRESCDGEQDPQLSCNRDDNFQNQQNTTEKLLRLIQTVDEMKKHKPSKLLKLINAVQSRAEPPQQPVFDFEQFLNSQQLGAGAGTQPHHTPDLTDPCMGLTQAEIETFVRVGGNVAGYTVVPRGRFNGLEIHRLINLREISSTGLADYTAFLHDTFSEIVAFSRLLGGDGSLINITLSGPSLTSDVNTLLSASNDYSVDLFISNLEKIMQSNTDVQFDECLNLKVSIARSKQGGARRKLRDLAHNQVIDKNRLNLFVPSNIAGENNLCFAICLAHFLNPQKPHTELEPVASALQESAGYTDQHMISLKDIAQFERMLNIKIVVFYRTNTGKLEKYANTDVPHPKTVFLYLHDNHYFMIKNLKGFIGTPYVCEYCYQGFTAQRDHRCQYTCDVCNASECHLYPKKTKHCGDCLRYCRSDYCFQMHKKPPPGQKFAQCDVTKYCGKCNRRYHVSGINPKPHKCPADRCVHCNEGLVTDGVHQCFIQPVKEKEPNNR
ncbi:uncharacterized protein LOC132127485 [Carassius carassius]|uniref:uncharacterized protein LOC132127485 n=1 Tax=Carassius carassius TaxID=217509 RepID=UPI00286875AB|nr:uncharacterized protein LOC132127485 [Carassius carassius]